MNTHQASFALAALCVALAPCASAQTTWVVSSYGGAQFTQVQPAVDAAAPGDTILVQPGFYSAVTIDKGVLVLASQARMTTLLGANITVRDVPAGQRAVVRGFITMLRSGPAAEIEVRDCAGSVHLDRLRATHVVDIRRSPHVSLRDVTTAVGELHVEDSTVTATDCRFRGATVSMNQYGLFCRNSQVTAAGCQFRGGDGNPFQPVPWEGVLLDGGLLVLAGTDSVVAAGTSPFAPTLGTSAIEARSGTLTIDPGVTLLPTNGAPAVRGAATTAIAPVADTRTDVSDGILTGTLNAPGATFAWLIADVPVLRPLATPFGSLWVGPTSVVVAAAPPGPSGELTASVGVAGLPPGFTVVLQGAVRRGSTLALATPAVTTVEE
ncbi:MAG: hypothetical protein AAF628_20435 [Planctomycetota bacterium]